MMMMTMMKTGVTALPDEIWTHVFTFLSSRDKLSVRSSCRFFKRLIDCPALWRDSTLRLRKISSYKPHFWRMLGKRKTASLVLLTKVSAEECTRLARLLPFLSSVTLHQCCDGGALAALRALTRLRRLLILRCLCPSLSGLLAALTGLHSLTLCDVIRAPRTDVIKAVTQMTNLRSLHYHPSEQLGSKTQLHRVLSSLPKLIHLSLNMGSQLIPLPSDYLHPHQNHTGTDEGQCGQLGLTSLELLNYADPVLSPQALQGLPSLKRLTVQYRSSEPDSCLCHLKTWLLSLPCLSELNISLGFQLGAYAKAVPSTVDSLSLKQVSAEPEALRDISQRVPGLQHLRLDLFWHEKHSVIAAIPQLFPSLQSLEMRHHRVPEADFLGLAQLSHLKRLVLLDPDTSSDSALMDLTHKLQMQTNYRVHVIHSSGPKDENTCFASVADKIWPVAQPSELF